MDTQHEHEAALRERVKELTCLYALTQLANRSDTSLEGVLRGAAELLPESWRYPEAAEARITFDGDLYATANFAAGGESQSVPLVVKGRPRGCVEIVYTDECPPADEGPFLAEERRLLEAVAYQLALIIEHREAQEHSERMQDQLRHADRLATIGQLAAGVAHELNEPLCHILGFAQLSRKHEGLPEPAANDLSRIIDMCLHARQIISNLLLFARQAPLKKSAVCLNTVVEEALELLEPRCARNGIEVVIRLRPELPAITADASQLRQVLVDLVVNAIQAMPDGGKLEIATGAGGGGVVLSVADDGVGMSPEVLKDIFIPFFTTKDVNKGTGLGLPVVHGIVTAHNGSIDVRSKPGEGTVFELEFPTAPETEQSGATVDDAGE